MGNAKRKPSLVKSILNLVAIVPTFFSVLGNVITFIELEAQLAGKSLVQLIVLSIVFGTLLTATWVGVLAMLFIYFQSLSWTPLFSLFIILVINIITLTIVAIFLCTVKKNLFFPEIRNQLRYLQRLFRNK